MCVCMCYPPPPGMAGGPFSPISTAGLFGLELRRVFTVQHFDARALGGGSVNRCFQFPGRKFFSKSKMRKTREETPTNLHGFGLWEYLGGKSRVFRCLVFEVALFCARYLRLQPVL
jgi:hypothetical protein